LSTAIHGFVPIEQWPTLEEMGRDMAEYRASVSDQLSGREITLHFDNGWVIQHHFQDAGTLSWTILAGEEQGASGRESYEAIELRPGVLLVDFLKRDHPGQDVTWVLDLATGQATLVISSLVETERGARVHSEFLHAGVDAPPTTRHARSDQLAGKRLLYRYSSRHAYEHIYLNEGTFTWYCVAGPEQGMADTEQTRVYQIADQLFLLFWTEKVMPVDAVICVDLQKMCSNGRFFGWDPKPAESIHLLLGARAELLNETTYEL
jgi:MoaF C-terminal domain/MoaF N-terminal domain